MNISEIVVGKRVLVYSGHETKEHALVKAILENGMALVRLSDGRIVEMHPQFIIKKFEE